MSINQQISDRTIPLMNALQRVVTTSVLLYFFLFTTLSVAKEAYHIRIGDEIHIALPGEDSLNRGFTVNKQGQITLEEIGILKVAGLSEPQLQQEITQALSRVFKDLNGIKVYLAQKQMLIFC